MSARASRSAALVIALGLAGCGAGASTIGPRLHADLDAVIASEASTDTARRAREAIASAERAEAVGLVTEAEEHASRARAWAEVDVGEREVVALEEELGRAEEQLLELEAQASASEHEAADRRARTIALADARAAREELARAFARAEADESAPRRARRVGLADGPEVRRLADVLADRARVLLAAARSLGASSERVMACEVVLGSIEPLEDPAARLAAADRAHGLARVALADARHRRGSAPGSPSPEEIASFEEALETEGFAPLRDEHGLGARVTDAFEGNGIAPAARGRLRRLGELVASHPAGPILLAVEADGAREAQAQASRRLEALRRAIVGDRTRDVVVTIAVEVRVPGSVPATAPNAARVVLPAYVPRPPEPVAPAALETPTTGESEPAGE
jgi:hypothetical protein